MNFFEHFSPRYPLASIAEYRLFAKKRLPKFLFGFIDGRAFQEKTKRRNHQDYESIQLKKRVLKDVSQIEIEV
jgi:L-lactate dehydrogenase (cytochrome)